MRETNYSFIFVRFFFKKNEPNSSRRVKSSKNELTNGLHIDDDSERFLICFVVYIICLYDLEIKKIKRSLALSFYLFIFSFFCVFFLFHVDV